MNRKLIILVFVVVLSVNCEEFLESNNKITESPAAEFLYKETQDMLVKNLKNAMDMYTKYNEAYSEFKDSTPDHMRHLQYTGECLNDGNCIFVPYDHGCRCRIDSDCCSQICQSNYCVPN